MYRDVTGASAGRREPSRRWVGEVGDERLERIVDFVLERTRVGQIRSCWLVGRSQGGVTAERLLESAFFEERVDGWVSISGGRIGG